MFTSKNLQYFLPCLAKPIVVSILPSQNLYYLIIAAMYPAIETLPMVRSFARGAILCQSHSTTIHRIRSDSRIARFESLTAILSTAVLFASPFTFSMRDSCSVLTMYVCGSDHFSSEADSLSYMDAILLWVNIFAIL